MAHIRHLPWRISSIFSSNSEAFASELQENNEEMFSMNLIDMTNVSHT